MDFTATHTEALIDNYRTWVAETDPAVLRPLFRKWLAECAFQVLNEAEHHFQPQGYTCLWLLGESHLALHTFPEKGLCYVELSSCNSHKNKLFSGLLARHFTQAD